MSLYVFHVFVLVNNWTLTEVTVHPSYLCVGGTVSTPHPIIVHHFQTFHPLEIYMNIANGIWTLVPIFVLF